MSRVRSAPGGGRLVDVAPDRLVGWVTRFVAGHGGARDPQLDGDGVLVTAADGATAHLTAPFGPLRPGGAEPLEALLEHVAGIGTVALLLHRAGAHSAGLCRDGVVLASSTDRHHVQGRTAAGGWSQQRYARRRGNQRTAAEQDAAEDAARVWSTAEPAAVLLGGDRTSLTAILGRPELARWAALPQRWRTDVREPRRAVLDEVAARSLDLTVRVTDPPAAP